MTTRDAGQLLAYLVAAYPNAVLEPASQNVYVEHLKRLDDPETGRTAADQLVLRSSAFPSIAEFREEYMALRRRHMEEQAHNEIHVENYEAVAPPDFALEAMRRLGMETEDGPTPESQVETLEQLEPGRCDDCGKHSSDGGIDGPRFKYGKFALCRLCAVARMRVKLHPDRDRETVADEKIFERKEEPVEAEAEVREEV